MNRSMTPESLHHPDGFRESTPLPDPAPPAVAKTGSAPGNLTGTVRGTEVPDNLHTGAERLYPTLQEYSD